jgi:hypothetical protein
MGVVSPLTFTIRSGRGNGRRLFGPHLTAEPARRHHSRLVSAWSAADFVCLKTTSEEYRVADFLDNQKYWGHALAKVAAVVVFAGPPVWTSLDIQVHGWRTWELRRPGTG